jgi:hypothetical protein
MMKTKGARFWMICLSVGILSITGACGAIDVGIDPEGEIQPPTDAPSGEVASQRSEPEIPEAVGPTKQAAGSEGEATDDAWMTYINDNYGYTFQYPNTAELTETGVQGFRSEDLPEGMTPEEYIATLEEDYGANICVEIRTGLAYLYISAPVNQGARFNPCGPTGLGAFEIVDQREQVTIGTATYESTGVEFIGDGDSLAEHGELMSLTLPDGTRLAYGSIPRVDATYEDYLMEGEPLIYQIMATYSSTE